MTTIASALRSGNGQIVHRSIYGELADRAAGKTQRLHDKAIGGDGDLRAVEIEMGGISERFRGRAEEQRSEKSFDQPAAGFTAGAMSHFDLRLAEAKTWRHGSASFSGSSTFRLPKLMVTIAVLRCS